MNLEHFLEGLGLPRNEARVYLALLATGASTSGAVIKRCGLHAPRVYEALSRLEGKGLVSHSIRNKRKVFEAVPPECLVEQQQEKAEKARKVLPELRSILEAAGKKEETATIFQGVRGLRTVLDSVLDELSRGEGYLDFGVSGLFREVMGHYWSAWQAEKKKKKIKSKCIFEEKVRGSNLHEDYFGLARFVPSKFHCPSDTIIFKDKIVIFAWTADPPTAVVVRDAATAQGYKNIFNWMWSQAEK